MNEETPHQRANRLARENRRLREAILWALGENGEFAPEPEPLAGRWRRRYWWRTELRRRAFGSASGEQS